MRALNVVFFTAVAVSIVHYTDNYLAFDQYPNGGPGPEVTENAIWIAWLLLTAIGFAGYFAVRAGRIRLGCGLLAAYSISGLIGLAHYSAPGMSNLEWWRHAHIWADIICGAAVLIVAIRLARKNPRRLSPVRVTT